jgi:hypothetical protein
MSDWANKPYSGGPMVAVAGFPRPLYPPDAAKQGKQASMDGPDAEAYKRVVSRLGRWPAQAYDRAYSNAFAHGKSGNLGETGLAGVQRQQHLDATGWVGQATFNTLRSARVPEGLPGAGEMAMDANAVALINQAFKQFGGHEPAPPPSQSVRQLALELAAKEVGKVESPAGSNNQAYGSWYGMNGVPWCAIFCTWAYDHAGDTTAFVRGSRYSYVPYIVADARAGRYKLATTDDPIPGDLVCYDWAFDGTYDHVGMFEAWQPGSGTSFTAIEGNTSTSNNSNGGQVMRRTRNRSSQATVFVRVGGA